MYNKTMKIFRKKVRREYMKHVKKEFELVYKKYAKQIYGYILKLCKNPTEAEDILQITFLKAIEKSDSFDGNCEISTWLCRIAHNAWLDERKRRDNRNDSIDSIQSVEPVQEDFTDGILDKQFARQILGVQNQLQEPYKEVFLLRVYGENSFREIGNVFGKSENWARVTYYRAKEQIRTLLGKE